jgi:hypothetical protein
MIKNLKKPIENWDDIICIYKNQTKIPKDVKIAINTYTLQTNLE